MDLGPVRQPSLHQLEDPQGAACHVRHGFVPERPGVFSPWDLFGSLGVRFLKFCWKSEVDSIRNPLRLEGTILRDRWNPTMQGIARR